MVYATAFRPPSEYRQWYRQVERCVGHRGDFRKIVWTVTALPWNEGRTYGNWTGIEDSTKEALVVLNALDWRNEFYVKHEMLHDVLWRSGWKAKEEATGVVQDSAWILRHHPAPWYPKCAPIWMTEMRRLNAAKQGPWRRVYRP